ncbi:hypothetical protein ACROYT_G031416 [Oculina patagonica]
MYGGPRRPTFSPFQGRARAPSPNFRPRFENPGFQPPGHNVYPSQRQPFPPPQRQFMNYPAGPQRARPGFQPGVWQSAGPRQGFRPTGYPEQQRPHRGRGRGNRWEDSSGIEAYYRHSMVEDPWKELEEKYKERNKHD